MRRIYLIIILVFTVVLGLFFDANAEERNCKPELTCFVNGDFLEYSTYEDGKLVWKTTYEYAGLFDENKIFVLKTDEDFDEWFSFLIDGKETDIATTGIEAYLSSGISAQILYGYSFDVIQPSPVNTDRWLKYSPSAEDWKGKVTEENFIYKDKTRSVIIVKGYEFTQTIDKQTGILLFLEYTGPQYDSYFQELTSTNIIDGNPGKKITLEPIEPIKNQKVPDWIKNNARWWADGQIDDQTFVNGIQFLIKENIIVVEKSTEKPNNQAQNIPVWIKNNARWWSEDSITEDDFLKGIQYLASNGVINVGDSIACDTTLWDYVYHPSRLKIINDCTSVSGTISSIRVEADGDYHIGLNVDPQYQNLINEENIQNQHGNLVLEVICQKPVKQESAIKVCSNYSGHIDIPNIGDHVIVTGPYVLDLQHGGWAEIHPVNKFEIIQ